MDCKKTLEDKILSIGGKIKIDTNIGIIVSFYHKIFSEPEINILSTVDNIRTLAFYVCNIENENIKNIAKIKSIERLGFYSCQNITDFSLNFIKDMPNLKSLTFVDTPISKEAIEEFKKNFPELEIREPAYNK